MSRREQLAYVLGLVENATPKSAEYIKAVDFARGKGITTDMHVGNSQEWFVIDRDNKISEWLMGQFVSFYLEDGYVACNSAINLSISFLNGEY